MKTFSEKLTDKGDRFTNPQRNSRVEQYGSIRGDRDLSTSSDLKEREIANLRKRIRDLEDQHITEKENLKAQLEEAMKKRLVTRAALL